MGYTVKVQRVERKTTKSYYVNFPAAIAEAMGIEKGEEFEWIIEDKNELTFSRVEKKKFKTKKTRAKGSEKA